MEGYIDLRKKNNKDTPIKNQEMEKRTKDLEDANFSAEFTDSIRTWRKTLFTGAEDKLDNLKKLGFKNPIKLVENQPSILIPSPDSIKDKLDNLKKLGFMNPIKLVENQPSILSCNSDSIKEKLENLTKLGFINTHILIENQPSILNLNKDSVVDRIDSFKSLGFKNPTKLIESKPEIICLNKNSIIEKIDNIKLLGFKDPIKLIESLPAILGLNQDTVKNKVSFYNKVAKLYLLPLTGNDILENVIPAWGSKRSKVLIYFRIYKDVIKDFDKFNYNKIDSILRKNLENTIIAYDRISKINDLTYSRIIKEINNITKENLTKEQKQEMILKLKDKYPKIVDEYLRGYPINKN